MIATHHHLALLITTTVVGLVVAVTTFIPEAGEARRIVPSSSAQGKVSTATTDWRNKYHTPPTDEHIASMNNGDDKKKIAHLKAYTHNNEFTFSIQSGVSNYTVSYGGFNADSCGHVISSGQPFSGWWTLTGQTNTFDIVAGRHGTSGVANSFNTGITPQNAMVSWSIDQHVESSLPGSLNFWVGDTSFNESCALIFLINDRHLNCWGLRLGQGHTDSRNNWWIAGPSCSGAGGTGTLTCDCYDQNNNFVLTPLSFVESGDSSVSVYYKCTDGYNCDCTTCGIAGYSYFCTPGNECHDTHLSCSASCGQGSCIATSTCAPRTTCPAPEKSQCTNGKCCTIFNGDAQSWSNSYQCIASDQFCCDYNTMTCPMNTTCDPATGTCLSPPPSGQGTTECHICEFLVKKIQAKGESKACATACDLLEELAPLCLIAMKAGLCSYIMKQLDLNAAPKDICTTAGLCGVGATCTCGYCTPSFFGSWCLSLPNHCPASGSQMHRLPGALNDTEATALAKKHAPATRVVWKPLATILKEMMMNNDSTTSIALPYYNGSSSSLGPFAKLSLPIVTNMTMMMPTEVCGDGMCDAAHVGCCLTCAP